MTDTSQDANCHEITEGHELVVVECHSCQGHIGIDASYLEQVSSVIMSCIYCGNELQIGSSE